LRDGRISYPAARLIARCADAEPETDEALIALTEREGLTELRAAVRAYLGDRDQERPPPAPTGSGGSASWPAGTASPRIEGLLTDEEAAEAELMIWRLANRDDDVEGDRTSAAADSDDPDSDSESAAADPDDPAAADFDGSPATPTPPPRSTGRPVSGRYGVWK
jgi:hypothetical protein